jgi:hypothetical protein
MLINDVSEVKLPAEAKQNNLPPKCGQPIDEGSFATKRFKRTFNYQNLFAE